MKTLKLIALLLLASPFAHGMIIDLPMEYTSWSSSDNHDNKNTPLHIAVQQNNKNRVLELLNEGADINAKNRFGLAPLTHAVDLNNADLVQLLLDHGANIETTSNEGWTPLMSIDPKVEIVLLLLMNGANANYHTKNSSSGSPLFLCAEHGHNNIARLFILNGADPTIKGGYSGDRTAEQEALECAWYRKGCDKIPNTIKTALEDRKKLLAFYGDQKSVGNIRTRTKRIIETLTNLLPKELLRLICDYDICIFTLETMIPSDQDLALIKGKAVQMEEVIECQICYSELNDENLIQLECHEAHKMCKTCFANDKLTKCPWCQGPIK